MAQYNYEAAAKLHQEVLVEGEKLLGEEHPDTLSS